MTSAQQKRFYFPKWQDTCRANDWHMVSGRLLGVRDAEFGQGESRKLYNAVWDAAETLAREAHRAVKPDDLRHACHIVALGKDFSSHELTTTQLNRVARLFEILADPDDIDAMIAWTDPDQDKRKSLVRWINKLAPEAYICELARMFPSYSEPYWEDLPIANLVSLARLLKKRTEDRNAPIERPETATADTMPEKKPIDLSKAYR